MPYFHLLPFVNNEQYGEVEMSQALVFVYLFPFLCTYSLSLGSMSSMINHYPHYLFLIVFSEFLLFQVGVS